MRFVRRESGLWASLSKEEVGGRDKFSSSDRHFYNSSNSGSSSTMESCFVKLLCCCFVKLLYCWAIRKF